MPLHVFLRKHILTVFVIFALTLVGEHLGKFRAQETHGLDAMLNLHTPPESASIFLVTIGDEDYEELFHATSPLDPAPLHVAVRQILRGKPAVLAVDLETSSPRFGELDWPKATWVRAASPVLENPDNSLDDSFSPEALSAIRRGRFLGERGTEKLPDENQIILTDPPSGPSLFLADGDGLIRRFRNLYFSPEADPPSENKGYVESFAWTIARQYARYLEAGGQDSSPIIQRVRSEEARSAEERSEEIILTFGGSRDRFRRLALRQLLQAAEKPFWEDNSPLKDSIVILGGTYAASRDVYITPVGPRYGIELIAHSVETILANGGIREFNHYIAHGMDIFVGVVLLAIVWRFPGDRAFLATVLVTVGLTLLASFVAFRSFAYWFNFAPMVGGLWLHLKWEKRKARRELEHEIHRLRKELDQLRSTSVTAQATPQKAAP